MSYNVFVVPQFKKELKKLAKKYPSIKNDFTAFIKTIELNPKQGISLGNNCYKVRIAIQSKGKGKRGGARIITHFLVDKATVFLLSIYDKSSKNNLSKQELIELLKDIPD